MPIDETVVDQVLVDGLTVADRLRTDPAPDEVTFVTLEGPAGLDSFDAEFFDTPDLRTRTLVRRPTVRRLSRPTKPAGVKTRFPAIKLDDPGFWLGAIAPVVVFVVLLGTMGLVSDATVQSVLALSAGGVGAVYVAITALALASRLGVNTDDIVKVLDEMTAVIGALKQEVQQAQAGEQSFELKIVQGKLASGEGELKAAKGDSVKLTVQADADCKFYLTTYIPELELKAGASQEKSFKADTVGEFALGITDSSGKKKDLGKLTVSDEAASDS